MAGETLVYEIDKPCSQIITKFWPVFFKKYNPECPANLLRLKLHKTTALVRSLLKITGEKVNSTSKVSKSFFPFGIKSSSKYIIESERILLIFEISICFSFFTFKLNVLSVENSFL